MNCLVKQRTTADVNKTVIWHLEYEVTVRVNILIRDGVFEDRSSIDSLHYEGEILLIADCKLITHPQSAIVGARSSRVGCE